MISSTGYAALRRGGPLEPLTFERRDPGPRDVVIAIRYCGVCHTDVHHVRYGGPGMFPMVPGHEIVGTVVDCGTEVERFSRGDAAAVGSVGDSCRSCRACARGLEQYCERGFVAVYRGTDRAGRRNYGGYSSSIVVDERYALRVPPGVDLAGTAPLLCAGVTTYSALKHWRVGPGSAVAIVGLGGLGHVAVKLARALGAHVTVFTSTDEKVADARRFGAAEVMLAGRPGLARAAAGPFDLVIDTLAAPHTIAPYLEALAFDGTLVVLGIPEQPISIAPIFLEQKRLSLSGSLVGGIDETQELLDFCAARGIAADVERIALMDVNAAHERLLKKDVKYRFVIDMAPGRFDS